MGKIAFRLSSNRDPEERLEEAALWKAMHDEYGDDILVLKEGEKGDPSIPTFGRELTNPFSCGRNPVREITPYWKDPAFLTHCNRSFRVCDLDEAIYAVDELHEQGLDAFVKSTRSKHAIFKVPRGKILRDVMGDMVFSFIDGGPQLIVQEFADIQYEHRFFVIGREIITSSPVQPSLTPLDYGLPFGTVFQKPSDKERFISVDVVTKLDTFAEMITSKMADDHVSIDCAIINGRPGIIEMHPTKLGQIGLFACNVRALAKASRKLISGYTPSSANEIKEEEEAWEDSPTP